MKDIGVLRLKNMGLIFQHVYLLKNLSIRDIIVHNIPYGWKYPDELILGRYSGYEKGKSYLEKRLSEWLDKQGF